MPAPMGGSPDFRRSKARAVLALPLRPPVLRPEAEVALGEDRDDRLPDGFAQAIVGAPLRDVRDRRSHVSSVKQRP